MIHERKKIARIVEELTLFFFALGADKIRSGIEEDGKNVVIDFQANYRPENEYKLEQMEKDLNCPKNDGMKDVYWELAGSGEPEDTEQLLLVGMMIDKAASKNSKIIQDNILFFQFILRTLFFTLSHIYAKPMLPYSCCFLYNFR